MGTSFGCKYTWYLIGSESFLLSQDSVCIGTVTSFDNGITNNNYQIGNVPGSGNYILHLEKKGYTSIYKNVTLKYHKSRRPTVILDAIPMHREMVRKLKEVKVTATLVKMVMKKDTVVYNVMLSNWRKVPCWTNWWPATRSGASWQRTDLCEWQVRQQFALEWGGFLREILPLLYKTCRFIR